LKILAIDTATETCSAAISLDGDINERYEFAPRRHAELILPMVDQLLSEAEIKLSSLDALAFGRGPGAFTGVRIATGVIQGLAFAADLPVVPVSTLAALAQGTITDSQAIISAIDARMGEIYWCLYKPGTDKIVAPLCTEQISKPESINITDNDTWFGVGSGWQTYNDILQQKLSAQLTGFDGEHYPHARDIITLAIKDFNNGKAVSAEEALPVYLRNKVTG